MNLKDHEFDTVVLGFDEKSKETVESLKEEGKRVLYIPIDPQTMITMMAQKRVYSTETDESITHLQIQQHQMQTSFQNTTTYLLQPIVQMYDAEPITKQAKDQVEEVVKMDLHIPSEDSDGEVALNDEVKEEEAAYTSVAVDTEDTREVVEESASLSSPTVEDLEEKQEELEEELEVVEEQDKHEEKEKKEEYEEEENISFPMVTPLAKECSLIDNRMLGIRRNKYPGLQRNEKNSLSNSMISSYHLFNPIRIEEEQSVEEEQKEAEIEQIEAIDEKEVEQSTSGTSNFVNDKNNFIFQGPPSMNPIAEQDEISEKLPHANPSGNTENQSIWNETEDEKQTLQASSIKENKLPDMDELLLESHLEETEPEETNTSAEEKEITSNSESDDENKESIKEQENADSHTLVLNRDIRLRKKFSFHQLHQETKSNPIVDPTEQEKTTTNQNVEEKTKKPDVFPLEPFSSRRRNKKNRLFSSLESAISNPIVQPNATAKTDKSFSSLIQESIIQHDLEDEPTTATKNEQSDDTISPEKAETESNTIETNSDNLKIDNIEFEEPYGYNSFEDFFPSFSNSNDRKRQEMDKIEKRKIALRGLHNLINNLG